MNFEASIALEEALYERLDPTVRRELWLRRWRGWAMVAAAAAACAVGLRALEEHTGMGGGRLLWAVLALATVVAAVLIHRLVERHAPDLRALARTIERTQPELRALLLTAVAEATAPADGRLGYLQQEVIREAVRQANPRAWSRAVPTHSLWTMGLATAAGTGVFVALLAGALLPELPALWPDGYGLTVSPGDTEAERGTTVVVLARFSRAVPSHVTLVLRAPGHAPVRQEMSKNLGDPVFAAVTAPLGDPADYQIEYAGHRSGRFHIETFARPELERVDARVAYPAQPGLPAKDIQDARRLSVAEGARVTLTFRLTRPVSEAQLVSEEGTTVRLAAAGKRRDLQAVTLDPERTGHYDLHLYDERRRPSQSPAVLTIEVHGNTAPHIALSFPGRDVRVSPLEEVTVEAKLTDDVGLAIYGVSYALDHAKEREVRLGGGGGERAVTARAVVPLETLGAAPDDLLSYYFWAEDVAADGTRRRVASDMYFAEVRPFEERFREGAAQTGSGAAGGGASPGDDLSRRQKDLLNATWRLEREARDGAVAEALRSDVEVVRKGQEDLKKSGEALRLEPQGREMSGALDDALAAMGQAVTRLASALTGPPASGLAQAREPEQAAYAALLRMRAREHQVSRGRSGGQGSAAEARDQALDELELKQKDSRYETRTEAEAQDQPGREDRQVLSRLRELAERQKALTDRLKELQLALQQARAAEREELEQRLKRLREEQQDMLGDLDELLQRLDRPENRSRLAQARGELESTRARASEASEALARGDTGRAVGAGTRAERTLDRVREQLQRQVSRGFGDQMRALRAEAGRLTQRQAALGEAIRKTADPQRPGPGPTPTSSPTENRRLAEAMRAQRAALSSLLERMRRVTEDAEPSSPLLSRKLYDAFRKAKIDGVERGADRLGELLDQNLAPQAAAEEPRVARAVSDLDQGVGEAAKGVVGDESEALRAARAELEALLEQARGEGAQARGEGTPQGAQKGGQKGGQTPASGRGGAAARADAPITGEGYRAFSDRLRDVSELLADPALRGDAARVLERARAMRAEFKRHSEGPRWELFEAEVVRPLAELRDKVGDELRRLAPEQDRLAPIDRDPVPARFTDLVRRYYKSLAGE